MYTRIGKRVEQLYQYRYMYQGERVTHRTCLYEYNEASRQDHREINTFIESIPENEKWLRTYLTGYYKTPKQDGTTEPDYLMNRCARLLGKVEMERSWKTK